MISKKYGSGLLSNGMAIQRLATFCIARARYAQHRLDKQRQS
nr:MAG TPA: Cytochrome C oxidase chain VIIB [Caudoviricetes sp.]